jgi:murein DD-endopeptidase MepM/ murein hydrolase activator NlpD
MNNLKSIFEDLVLWKQGWANYLEKKINRFGKWFEKNKDVLVDVLMARRGSYQRPFLHFSLGILFIAGVMSAPILASTKDNNLSEITPPSSIVAPLDLSEYGIETQVSDKPPDQAREYIILPNDTLSSISEKFNISIDTIRWANNLKRDSLTVGDKLIIPPVTGIIHKVREGDTIYSIAKKYKTDAQKILNYPFNDFSDLETFALNVGQNLIVPDGVISAAPVALPPSGIPIISGGTGQFMWPTNGVITQYPVWYHMAVDIANSSAPGIMAADSGTVVLVEYLKYGYGQHVMIAHGNGFVTLYGHMSEIYVKTGEAVSRGQVIGRMGSTGRSTGTHLHFEVRKDGTLLNPLSFLK